MNEVINLLKNQNITRRNQFTDKSIDQQSFELIKASILKTANASNRQSYSIITLDTAHAEALDLPGDKVLLFCIDFYRIHRCAEALNCDFDSQYTMQFITALIDISMLAQSSILAAQSLGIDTLITNGIYHDHPDKTFKLLDIPQEYVIPMLAVCLGYSDNKNIVLKGRIDSSHIFHENTYNIPDDNEIDKIIQEYDDIKKNIGLIKDWEEKGYKHYLEWFFEKWCPIVGSRKQNYIFENILKEHGVI